MAFQALYRKFRPETFDEVTGQDPIVQALGNQIRANRIGHAYLFTGTRGTGKTTVAKIFARAVNCENPKEDGSPCMECAVCKGIHDGTLLNVVEMDAASNNGVEDVRSIIDDLAYSPTQGKYKVYIIDEAHNLSPHAFNALLKTLEEPPEYAIFILATTEVGSVPITIMSRCQRYDFYRMSIDTMTGRMQKIIEAEGVSVELQALKFIARMADGSMRDALSLLDRCLAFNYGQELTYDKALDVLGAVDTSVYMDCMEKILKDDLAGVINILDEQIMRGREIGAFVNDFIWYLRNMLLLSSANDSDADIADVLGVSTDTLAQLKENTKKTDTDTLMRFIRILSELSGQIRYSPQKRVLTEIAMVKLMRPQMEEDVSSIKQRLAQAERKINKIEAEGVKTAQTVVEPEKKKPDAPVPEALEGDVLLAVSNWKKIVRNSNVVIKNFLDLASPSTDGNVLVIKCEDKVQADTLRSEKNTELIREVFRKELKKEVNFRIYHPADNEGINEVYPDLSKFINNELEEVKEDQD